MHSALEWFVFGAVVGPLCGYLLLAIWMWVSEVVRVLWGEWRRGRRPQ